MTIVDFDAERTYDDEKFLTVEVSRSEQMKVVCGYFEPGQLIPIHAHPVTWVIDVRSGTGLIRDGDAGTPRRTRRCCDRRSGHRPRCQGRRRPRLEALLVTAPPPTDAEHEPVRRGLRTDEFDPTDT